MGPLGRGQGFSLSNLQMQHLWVFSPRLVSELDPSSKVPPPDFSLGHASLAASVLEAEGMWECGSMKGDGLTFQ